MFQIENVYEFLRFVQTVKRNGILDSTNVRLRDTHPCGRNHQQGTTDDGGAVRYVEQEEHTVFLPLRQQKKFKLSKRNQQGRNFFTTTTSTIRSHLGHTRRLSPPIQIPSPYTMTTESSEEAILTFLSTSPEAVIEDTYTWSESSGLNHATVVGAIKSLLPEQYVTIENLETSFYSLTDEGDAILANGSQEVLVLKALNEAGRLPISELQSKVGDEVAKIGMGNCMKSKWVKKDGADLVPLKTDDEVTDVVRNQLQALKDAHFRLDAVSEKVRWIVLFLVSMGTRVMVRV